MLVHRSTESLVIERLDIPATESPSVERDSFIFLDEDYRELEHDELSPVKTRKITRTMGTLVLFFLQLPQGRVHIRVRHSWSEESLEENLPDDLWSWGMSFTKGPSRGTRPSLYLSLRALLLLSLSITIFFDIGDCPHWNTKRISKNGINPIIQVAFYGFPSCTDLSGSSLRAEWFFAISSFSSLLFD